jgi:hypothetical protein
MQCLSLSLNLPILKSVVSHDPRSKIPHIPSPGIIQDTYTQVVEVSGATREFCPTYAQARFLWG